MTRPLLILALLILSACGADGPPLKPGTDEPGISIGGQVKLGVSGTL